MTHKNCSLKGVKLARVSTVAFFIDTQLHAQIKETIDSGADVSVIASETALNRPIEGCKYFSITIPRNIQPITDLWALLKLWKLFRNQKFHIVHSTTPKAGLLCAIAGRLAGVPVRLHTFTGQPWLTLSGVKRFIAMTADRVIGMLNTSCYTDSCSQRQFLIDQGLVSKNKLSVLGPGSLAGVDINRFNSHRYTTEDRNAIKVGLGIPQSAVVILFVGRIVADKGVIELVKAFHEVVASNLNAYLLFVGPQELTLSELGITTGSMLEQRVKFTGYTDLPEQYMAASDVLCIPSYREGFGTVVIEAAAMGLPAVGTNIYGLSDAIVDGETGLLVEPKNIDQLANALLQIINDSDLRKALGQNAQKRAVVDFSSQLINQQVVDEYVRLLCQAKRH
tara:strand:- start:218873 stop:220051 length:1179 start_codon:yes stop_codon:yes gene_type:complete